MSYPEEQERVSQVHINETREELNRLEQRFFTFTQQQFSFIAALDHCRKIAFEPNKEISTISQVTHYAHHVSDSATDKRILNMFLSLVKDLTEFRRSLVKLAKQPDERLAKTFAKWKKTLEPTQNISQLRTQFPNAHLNHLSVTEARIHFGGIISVMPTAMDCARDALNRVEATRAYRLCNSAVSRGSPKSSSTYRISSARQYKAPEKKSSPLISSPVPSHSSHSTFHTTSTKVPLPGTPRKVRCASAGPTYKRQLLMTQHPTVATQTPKFLGSAVKPMMDGQHKTLTEDEIRKTLKQRRHDDLSRPKWKP